jgi:hypothetical protein
MEKARMTKIGLVLGISIIVALGFMTVKAAEGDMAKPGDMMKQGDMAKPVKECTMKDMQECTMKCMANCEKNMNDIPAAIASLDNAVKAMDAGNTADAKMEIEKAKKMLKDMLMTQKKCMGNMPTVNNACPITDAKIDMMNTPENLITMYKGQKVGFCCPNCPPAWEKLTDKEKNEKLEKVMFKMTEKEKMMKNMPEARKMP